jgi:hypothetical protein
MWMPCLDECGWCFKMNPCTTGPTAKHRVDGGRQMQIVFMRYCIIPTRKLQVFRFLPFHTRDLCFFSPVAFFASGLSVIQLLFFIIHVPRTNAYLPRSIHGYCAFFVSGYLMRATSSSVVMHFVIRSLSFFFSFVDGVVIRSIWFSQFGEAFAFHISNKISRVFYVTFIVPCRS